MISLKQALIKLISTEMLVIKHIAYFYKITTHVQRIHALLNEDFFSIILIILLVVPSTFPGGVVLL